MGSLKDFNAFIEERRQVLDRVENKLCALQEKYETFFAEVNKVRASEFEQLERHVLDDFDGLPLDLKESLEKAQADAERSFEEKVTALEEQQREHAATAEKLRLESKDAEATLRQDNRSLDEEEESLKARNGELLRAIARYNDRIRELGRGFGFFRNLFRMRKLQAERRLLDGEQADLAARIEQLRQKWQAADTAYAEAEEKRKAEWLTASTEAAAVQTKIEYLNSSQERIVRRSALEAVLHARRPGLVEPTSSDPPCPRCAQPNPASFHFCHICAFRLTEDRPDLQGSLDEMAELNVHHERFSGGMQACQEIIGLIRGLGGGLTAFGISVQDMRSTQKKHSLKKLELDVPAAARRYGQHFDALDEKVDEEGLSLHPAVFAEHVAGVTADVFTEEAIKNFFETMGAELSKQADAQW
jgi:hypothetical protein